MDAQRQERREAIRAILRAQVVGTQEELGELLSKRGYEVTQATLSRDLAKLKARRVTLPEGGVIYELDELKAPESNNLHVMKNLIVGVEHNDSMVVVATVQGAAAAVALELDRSRLPAVLGTIAGDDTIFVAPRRKHSAAGLARQLQSLWRKGQT
jgi:transcriptional regulator of arginine metabolism